MSLFRSKEAKEYYKDWIDGELSITGMDLKHNVFEAGFERGKYSLEQKLKTQSEALKIMREALESIGYCKISNGCVSGEQCSCAVETAEEALNKVKLLTVEAE